MRTPFVAVLAMGGLLALGAWTDPDQSTAAASAEPTQVAGQQESATCAPGQTAGDDRRGVSRTHPRPRASSARPTVETDCRPQVSVVRRDAHRSQRNVAIDRSLNSGR